MIYPDIQADRPGCMLFMGAKVSVIIVNWNGKKFLGDCISSIFGQTYSNYEAILVDNGSTDGSSDFARTTFPRLKIIALDQNYGFAKGNNIGMKEAMKDESLTYILLLNVDTRLDPRFIEELVAVAESNDQIGACQPRMLNMMDTSLIDAAGITLDKSGNAIQLGYHEKDGEQFKQAKEVFGVNAGAALYRRSMLDKIGLFDEDFFIYFEDVDLAIRARLDGWKSVYVPGAVVYHNHSHAFGKDSPVKAYLIERNRYYYIAKTLPRGILLKFLLMKPASMVKLCLYLIIRKKDAGMALVYTRATIDGLKRLPQMLIKRRGIRKGKQVEDQAFKQWLI